VEIIDDDDEPMVVEVVKAPGGGGKAQSLAVELLEEDDDVVMAMLPPSTCAVCGGGDQVIKMQSCSHAACLPCLRAMLDEQVCTSARAVARPPPHTNTRTRRSRATCHVLPHATPGAAPREGAAVPHQGLRAAAALVQRGPPPPRPGRLRQVRKGAAPGEPRGRVPQAHTHTYLHTHTQEQNRPTLCDRADT
jgi:hypothetical protein